MNTPFFFFSFLEFILNFKFFDLATLEKNVLPTGAHLVLTQVKDDEFDPTQKAPPN